MFKWKLNISTQLTIIYWLPQSYMQNVKRPKHCSLDNLVGGLFHRLLKNANYTFRVLKSLFSYKECNFVLISYPIWLYMMITW